MKRTILNVLLLMAGISLFACGVHVVEKNYFFGIAVMVCAVMSFGFTIHKWRANWKVDVFSDISHFLWLVYLDLVLLGL